MDEPLPVANCCKCEIRRWRRPRERCCWWGWRDDQSEYPNGLRGSGRRSRPGSIRYESRTSPSDKIFVFSSDQEAIQIIHSKGRRVATVSKMTHRGVRRPTIVSRNNFWTFFEQNFTIQSFEKAIIFVKWTILRHTGGGERQQNQPKTCYVLFEWPLRKI